MAVLRVAAVDDETAYVDVTYADTAPWTVTSLTFVNTSPDRSYYVRVVRGTRTYERTLLPATSEVMPIVGQRLGQLRWFTNEEGFLTLADLPQVESRY